MMPSQPHPPTNFLAGVAEYADLRIPSEALPGLQAILTGLLQGLRAQPNHPLDMIEPALTFAMPGPVPVLTSTENRFTVEAENGNTVSDLPFLSLSQAATLIRSKALSPVELTRELLARIDLIDPQVQAYVTVLHEQALTRARQLEDQVMQGQPLGALHGIPIALKDLIETRGVRTTASSQLLQDYFPQRQATVAQRLEQAGAILLGKTNTHEFAFGGMTPPTRNPWQFEHIPGGSSGGSAAAIAAGLALGALGTDTAGSIRIPSSLCGTVGLKPTYGRVSRYGVIPASWSLDHVGPIARSVEDTALLLQAIAGYDRQDPASAAVPSEGYQLQMREGIRGLKVGVPRRYFYERLQQDVADSLDQALQNLQTQGAEVHEVDTPWLAEALPLTLLIDRAEGHSYHQEWLRTKAELYQADVRGSLQAGGLILASDYLNAQRRRRAIQAQTLAVFEHVDVLVTPTQPGPAIRIGQEIVEYPGGEEDIATSALRLTAAWNITGLPALTVPCGLSRGLPLGMQIVGRPFEEATVLRVGYAYEQATDWHTRRPSLS